MAKLPKTPPAKRVKVDFTKPSKTVRSQAYETDINNMVKGLVPFSQSRRKSFYIDETVLPSSYEEHYNAVADAQFAFMQLPPDIRERFANDPALLARAFGDPSQHAYLRELGLLEPLPTSNPRQAPPEGADAPSDSAGE